MPLFDDIKTPWEDPKDLLSRNEYADSLTTMLDSRPGPYVMNLNAAWGAGKTFFLRHWAASLQDTHKVVYINAWESDFSDDPMLAVMSSIQQQLISDLENKELAKGLIAKGGRFLKAIAPTVLAGLTRKAIGSEAFEDATDLLKGISKDDAEIVSDMVSDAASHVLADHQAKEQTIKDFKNILTEAATQALETDDENVKVLVFVDELDRCRPSYAVELLESIKHLYSIKRMAFVVATDTDQLQHAICAIYGAGFHGERYLRRFFDTSFTLPDPKYWEYVKYLVSFLPPDSLNIHWRYFKPPSVQGANAPTDGELTKTNNLARILAFMAEACALDLRSMNQVWRRGEAILLINQKYQADAVWLFALLTLQVASNNHFESLVSAIQRHEGLDGSKVYHQKSITMLWQSPFEDRSPNQFLTFSEIITGYVEGLRRALASPDDWNSVTKDPVNLTSAVHADAMQNKSIGTRAELPLVSHLDAVLFAGHIQ